MSSKRKAKGWQYRPEWLFDKSPIPDPHGKGKRAEDFLERLQHPKSMLADNAFHFPEWFRRVVRRAYGDTNPDGSRKIREVLLLLPRGNRKSTFAAGIGLLHTIGPEKVQGGQCIIAARDREQAGFLFNEASGMLSMNEFLAGLVRNRKAPPTITHKRAGSHLLAVSADALNKHGGTVSLALEDEIHAWKSADLHNVLTSSMNKVPNAIRWMMTTAGRGTGTLAYEQYQYAKDVLRGRVKDPSFLPVLFEAPHDVDYRDEKIWHLVNPGLVDGYQDIDGIRSLARRARTSLGARATILNDHLNVWAQTASNPFIEPAVYDACKGKIDWEKIKDLPCWLGVDLSSSVDLSAIVACWKRENGTYIMWAWFFCPEDNLEERERLSEAPYRQWAKKEFITPTPGSTIDYRAIESKIRELCSEFDVQEVAFDPHMARQVQPNLIDEGLPCIDVRQVPSLMMPAIQETERAFLAREITHGGHPVLRFCFLNAEVEGKNRRGHASQWVKPKRWLSIDGAVAASMAILRASAGDSGRAYYDKEGAEIESVSWS